MKFLKAILAIWNYVRNSWEGEDGKFSYKRASQFLFVWLMAFMIINDRINSQWSFYSFLVLAILFGLTAAIITVPQLILLLKNLPKSSVDFSQNSQIQTEATIEQTPVEQLPG